MKMLWIEFKGINTERIPEIDTPLHRKQAKGMPGQQGISAQRLTIENVAGSI